jgi:hypothetical protein
MFFGMLHWTNSCVSIVLRKRSVMDMVVLVVVCLTAFVVIPRLWWSRGLRAGVLGIVPVRKAQEKVGLVRGSGIEVHEIGVRTLDPIISRAI